MPSTLELTFDRLWDDLYPDIDLIAEVSLIPGRRFRFDYVHPGAKVAIEINGQIWHKGGHSSGRGLMKDYEKLNLASSLGYCVFQLSDEMINARWLELIAATVQRRLEEKSKIIT